MKSKKMISFHKIEMYDEDIIDKDDIITEQECKIFDPSCSKAHSKA